MEAVVSAFDDYETTERQFGMYSIVVVESSSITLVHASSLPPSPPLLYEIYFALINYA